MATPASAADNSAPHNSSSLQQQHHHYFNSHAHLGNKDCGLDYSVDPGGIQDRAQFEADKQAVYR